MLARALLLSLLLMNLGVAAWWWQRPDVAPPASPPPPDDGVPLLRLLSEVDATGTIGDTPELTGPPEPAGGEPGQRCRQIGPFLTQSDLRRAIAALTPVVDRIQFRESRAQANRGFWVFLPAQETREQALATARQLSASGLRDYYVVTAGDRENTISLGLFRDQPNAEARRDEVQGLGFAPLLQERIEEIPNYWIEFAAEGDLNWAARLSTSAAAALQATDIDCT
jgi:hypothetical protein